MREASGPGRLVCMSHKAVEVIEAAKAWKITTDVFKDVRFCIEHFVSIKSDLLTSLVQNSQAKH